MDRADTGSMPLTSCLTFGVHSREEGIAREASGFTTIKGNGECSGPRLSTLRFPLFSKEEREGRMQNARVSVERGRL